MKKITLAHGSGGVLMHKLIGSLIIKELDNKILRQKKDSALLKIGKRQVAFTTDSYVVNPIFFPGGDIGSLSVYGTVNDLSVCGARPLYLSLAFIIEEGFAFGALEKIVRSAGTAAKRSCVEIVTGDTKVVEKGSCDNIFINTSGIGEVYYERLSIEEITPTDAVIISGPIGEHAASVMSSREGMEFKTQVKSDSAPLNNLIREVIANKVKVKFMRDPTRGGVGTTLNEIASPGRFGIALDEKAIPLTCGVRGACELLGLDPMYMACEGRVIFVVAREDASRTVDIIRRNTHGRRAGVIGEITKEYKGKVYMNTKAGGRRLIEMLSGEQLPRIC